MDAAGDQAGDVRDVGHEDRSNLAGNLSKRGKLDRPRDRSSPAEDELRSLPPGELLDLGEIHASGVTANRVLNRAKPLAADRDVPAMGEVTTHRERHTHYCIAGLAKRQVDSQGGGRA